VTRQPLSSPLGAALVNAWRRNRAAGLRPAAALLWARLAIQPNRDGSPRYGGVSERTTSEDHENRLALGLIP